MHIDIYQVDAFASSLFEGNPAAVCPLEQWLDDELMQHIAMENNLSETAFFVPENDSYDLRWFTPTTEVDLCGHATLATAHVLFKHLDYRGNEITFKSKSGPLTVQKEKEWLMMDFPASQLNTVAMPEFLEEAIGVPSVGLYRDMDYLYVVEKESQVRELIPDFRVLATTRVRGVIVTAPGDEVDFVSRFFAPAAGVDEDPVTGSAHTMLTPYWSKRLGKNKLVGRQISARGGTVYCQHHADRVKIGGQARTFMKGSIRI